MGISSCKSLGLLLGFLGLVFLKDFQDFWDYLGIFGICREFLGCFMDFWDFRDFGWIFGILGKSFWEYLDFYWIFGFSLDCWDFWDFFGILFLFLSKVYLTFSSDFPLDNVCVILCVCVC